MAATGGDESQSESLVFLCLLLWLLGLAFAITIRCGKVYVASSVRMVKWLIAVCRRQAWRGFSAISGWALKWLGHRLRWW